MDYEDPKFIEITDSIEIFSSYVTNGDIANSFPFIIKHIPGVRKLLGLERVS